MIATALEAAPGSGRDLPRAKEDDDDGDNGRNVDLKPGEARHVVTDSRFRTRADSERAKEAAMADAQTRADSIASMFGESAPKPLSGERVANYRARLLRRYQRYTSKAM